MIDAAAFTDIRNYIKRRVGYVRYKVGSTYIRTEINDVEITANGVVRVEAVINSSPVTITRVELYNNNGDLWAHQDISITISQGQTGILYWFDFSVEEG